MESPSIFSLSKSHGKEAENNMQNELRHVKVEESGSKGKSPSIWKRWTTWGGKDHEAQKG